MSASDDETWTEALNLLVQERLREHHKDVERHVVAACRKGDAYYDSPGLCNEPGLGYSKRYVLPRTRLGRRWKLWRAGYGWRLRGSEEA